MKRLISIDPGQSTGLVVGSYSDTEPLRLDHAFQIEGGVEGFLKAVHVSHGEDWDMNLYGFMYVLGKSFELYSDREKDLHEDPNECDDENCLCYETVRTSSTVLVEKFTARGSANAGFSYRTEALEPLRVEGAILALGIEPTWVQPPQQYFLPGDGKADRKKKQHAWLKEHGYYIAPKDVGCKDSDDARSALAHCISWLRRQKHKPTLELFRGEDDE